VNEFSNPRRGTAKRWRDTIWFLVAVTVCCWPIGVVLVWQKQWSRTRRIVVAAAIILVAVAAELAAWADYSNG
jgi:protein-S-isoprenylcysteine O-methyltransferase Ste14